jgi:hypothetical protein
LLWSSFLLTFCFVFLYIDLSSVCQQHHRSHLYSLGVLPLSWTTFFSCYQTYTMSDCTVGPDGKLLDAKDIVWFEDADSSEPINHAITPSSSTAPSTSATIHPFFCGGSAHAPAAVVTGACRSGHAICPSIKITDPDNAKASAFANKHKLKGLTTNPDSAEALATMHKHQGLPQHGSRSPHQSQSRR